MHETLLAAHLMRHSDDRVRPVKPWVYAVAPYKRSDHFRRKHSARNSLDGVENVFAPDSADEVALRADIDKLLARLPVRQRNLFVDGKLRGFSAMVAAHKHGLSVMSVNVMLHRSVKRLDETTRVKSLGC